MTPKKNYACDHNAQNHYVAVATTHIIIQTEPCKQEISTLMLKLKRKLFFQYSVL